jgi:hypothetical protein
MVDAWLTIREPSGGLICERHSQAALAALLRDLRDTESDIPKRLGAMSDHTTAGIRGLPREHYDG